MTQAARAQQTQNTQLGRQVRTTGTMVVEVIVAETGEGDGRKLQSSKAMLITGMRTGFQSHTRTSRRQASQELMELLRRWSGLGICAFGHAIVPSDGADACRAVAHRPPRAVGRGRFARSTGHGNQWQRASWQTVGGRAGTGKTPTRMRCPQHRHRRGQVHSAFDHHGACAASDRFAYVGFQFPLGAHRDIDFTRTDQAAVARNPSHLRGNGSVQALTRKKLLREDHWRAFWVVDTDGLVVVLGTVTLPVVDLPVPLLALATVFFTAPPGLSAVRGALLV